MLSVLNSIMAPVLALVIWTLIMTFWMFATRTKAMRKAKIRPNDAKRTHVLGDLPAPASWIADNYNHLHEQPVIFYALAAYCRLQGVENSVTIGLAWAYVVLRIIHSLIQSTSNHVPYRFFTFLACTLVLTGIAGVNVWQLIVG